MTYEELLISAENEGIEVVEVTFKGTGKGLHIEDTIFINKDISDIEKRCVLSEELGHYKTTYGNILDFNNPYSSKQENIARRWSYEKILGIIDIIRAFESGSRNRYEVSNFLNVTETFLDESINYYRSKYGLFFEIDNYIVYFEPNFGVMKKF
ncbi:MAG: hypothetical protein RR620_10400 [Clostridium sp.]